MITPLEKTILQVISIFESGHPLVYGTLIYVKGDTGELSGGALQASMASGNLGKMLRLYRTKGGTLISEAEVQQTEAKDPSQNTDPVIRAMFKAAAHDPIMAETQLEFFNGNFVAHAEHIADAMKITEPLGICLIADGCVHGSFEKIRSRVPLGLNQWEFCKQYIATRRAWLASSTNPILQKCVYRMAFFEEQVAAGNWKLNKFPVMVHGVLLT